MSSWGRTDDVGHYCEGRGRGKCSGRERELVSMEDDLGFLVI